MALAVDRYGEALGIWRLPQEKEDDDFMDLTLKVGDGRKLRDLIMDKRNQENRSLLFQKFEQFMVDLIKRDYPTLDEQAVRGYVEMNTMPLFESAQVTFRFTTEEELKQNRKEALAQLKKQTGSD